MNLENTLAAFTQLGASWVLWFLMALSVVCLAVIAERVVCYFSTRVDSVALMNELTRLGGAGEWSRVERLLSESPSYEARVASAGLAGAPDDAEVRMLSATEGARVELERNLALLATVGANAPFVGLLGTVIGIIGAFEELSRTQGLLSEALMTEIGEALVATAVGLLVALPAVAAFNFFRRVVERRLSGTELSKRVMLALIQGKRAEVEHG